MSRLRELLDDGRAHVLDGAMGTLLYERGVFVNVCYDELNLTDPDLVRSVHEEYVAAGAEILETNTFGANPVKLSAYGLDEKTEEINRAAASLALEAAGERGEDRVAVAGAIGPLGIRIEPFGPTSREEAREYFRRQIRGLLEGGAEGFVLETFSDLDELEQAARAVRSLTDLPIIAQVTVGEEGSTSYGTPVEDVAEAVSGWGVDAVGLNCSVGPARMLDAVERMSHHTDLPLSALPNAGLPRVVEDRKIYLASPEYMARYARRLVRAGVRFVGGCCGTTPEHVRAIRDAVRSEQPRISSVEVRASREEDGATISPVPLEERSGWGGKLARGEWVTSVELVPPRGWDPQPLLQGARRVQDAGIDVVSILDGARAQSRMGVLPASLLVERETGMEAVIHYSCRDRNMMGMISDLLGAAAAGLRNVLVVTGDPPVTGPYPDSTAVFDIDSIGLVNVLEGLNRGVDPGGGSIGEPTRWVIGVAMNPEAEELEREHRRYFWKVDAGANFAITQPIFDPASLERFLEEHQEARSIPVIAGLWPLSSVRNAEFLTHEVPGVRVPEEVIERIRRAERSGPGAARKEGIAIAREVEQAIHPHVAGIHVSTPGGDVGAALEVLARE